MFVKRFLRDVSATAAVEFAIIAPLMLASYFGLAEVTTGMVVQRRISHTASTIGDIVAQGSTTTEAQITDVFTAGQTIVAPFDTTLLQMRLTSIVADAGDVTTVDWSEPSGSMAALAHGASISVPSTVISAGQSVIRADVSYVYTSPINWVLTSPITFNYTYYLKPRVSNSVTCADC